tara:strand:+ start:812 stop:1747 length:936 start_codon:yes stop_codon:yes gene_type:complete
MSKALVILKNRGIGDICILASSVHEVSRKIGKPVAILAQKNTRAKAIFSHDPHVSEVIELDEKGFFNIIKKIKPKKFDRSYIYSDSIRLFLITKLSGIKENYHYKFFSKKGKNFFKTAKEFTEKTLNIEIDPQPKIYWNDEDVQKTKKKYNITNNTKNIICGISASGPTKRWDVNNYIRLFEELGKKYKSKFFLAGGLNDEELIKKVMSSKIGKDCLSFSKMKLSEAIPIIGASQYYIGNDTGWGHISSGLGLKSLFLFMDSPPLSYGVYSKNINIICPDGLTLENTKHNTRGKDKISFDRVLKKSIELIS